MRVTHKRMSSAPAPADPTKLGAADWNADHEIILDGGIWPIDRRPASPDPWDDEFDGDTLDTSKWTEALPSIVSAGVSGGAYNMWHNTPGPWTAGRFGGVRRPITPGRYIACLERSGGDYHYVGLFTGVSNAAMTRARMMAITFHGSYGGAGAGYFIYQPNPMAVGTDAEGAAGMVFTGQRVYVEYTVTATNIIMRASTNGLVWAWLYDRAIAEYLGDVGHLWLGGHWYSPESGKFAACSLLWARKVA